MEVGMDYPSIDELIKKYGSKYKIAFIAGMVAAEIRKNSIEFGPEYKTCSYIGHALEEMLKDKVVVTFDKN